YRAVHRAAMAPQRRSNRADAGAACALLPPELLARTAYFALVLRLMRSSALARHIVPHRLVQQVRVHPGREHVVGQLHRADLLACQVFHVHNGHGLRLSAFTSLPWIFEYKCTRPKGPAPRRTRAADFRLRRSSPRAGSSRSFARCPCVPGNAAPARRATETSLPRCRPALGGTSSRASRRHRENASASRRPEIPCPC